ncbi:MAG: hypothetical protein FIA99_11135 [Ruminiclostridium sp.]|nr:hypothetical protein [Ruminiclostridium sp.]
MKAFELINDLKTKYRIENPETTVDKIIIGNPEKEIKTVLVTWISDFRSIKAAVERGFDLLITHEPTFWTHSNEVNRLNSLEDRSFMKKAGMIKKKYIDESCLVIMRIHDIWDAFPEYGINYSWARFLGLGEKPAIISSDGYQLRYDIEPCTLDAFAGRIAGRTAELGEPMVQVIGEGSRIVSKIGLGAGYISTVPVALEMQCETSILCDDGSLYWSDIQCALDMDYPIIRVNHGTSEEPGIISLTRYLNENYPQIKAEHLPHSPYFRLIGA